MQLARSVRILWVNKGCDSLQRELQGGLCTYTGQGNSLNIIHLPGKQRCWESNH